MTCFLLSQQTPEMSKVQDKHSYGKEYEEIENAT